MLTMQRKRRIAPRGLRAAAALCALAMLAPIAARAQSGAYSLPTEKHAREFAITTGFATDLPGGAKGGNYWTAQIRFGRTLLSPRVLRGALEVATELEPVKIFRQQGFIYGLESTPLLQWNISTGGRLTPFINAGSGVLLTSAKFPRQRSTPENSIPTTTHLNFTPQGGVGAYWFSSSTRAWVMGVRFHHTSSAGLTRYNPGHNALYIHAGIAWWR